MPRNRQRALRQRQRVNNLLLVRRKLRRLKQHSKPQVRLLLRQLQRQQLMQRNRQRALRQRQRVNNQLPVRHKLHKPRRLKPHSKPQVRLLLRRVQLQQLMLHNRRRVR
jgi:hypothetical protein